MLTHPLFLVLLLAGIVAGQITQPRTGGTNADPNMVANPRINLNAFSTQSSLVRQMADIHDRFATYLFNRASSLGCETGALAAVILVESGGKGFGTNGRMIIRFENHVFKPRLNNNALFDQHFQFDPTVTFQGHLFRASTSEVFASFHGNQDKEWTVLQFAQGLNDLKALESASYGAPQIMGFNAQSIGYTNAREMFLAFSNSLVAQMDGMIDFIKGRSNCLTGLRTNDFVKFAGCYNGNGQAQTYGNNILNARNAYTTVLQLLGTTTPTSCTSSNGLSGTCGVSSCSGEEYTSTNCASNTKCCVNTIPCTPAGQPQGKCIEQSRCSTGTLFSGLCPGDASIRCCVTSTPPPTAAPTPPPTAAPTLPPTPVACQYEGLNGVCSTSCIGPNTFAYTDDQCTAAGSKCCVPAQSCSPQSGVTGECLDTSVCSGTTFTGLCPGSAAIKCCVKTKSPTLAPTLSPTTVCTHEGLSGYCSSTSTCTRQSGYMGYSDPTECGTNGFCCVPAQSCSNSAGRCVDTSVCPTGSTILSNLCPGSAKIKCCLARFNLVSDETELQDTGSSSESSEASSSAAVAAGVAVPIAFIASLAAVVTVYRRRRKSRELQHDQRWSVVAHNQQQGGSALSPAAENPLFLQQQIRV